MRRVEGGGREERTNWFYGKLSFLPLDLETLIYSLVRTCNDRRKAYLFPHCDRRTRVCPVLCGTSWVECGSVKLHWKTVARATAPQQVRKSGCQLRGRWKIHLPASCRTSRISLPIFYEDHLPPGYHRLLPQQLLSLGKWNGISRDKGSLFLQGCSLLFESMCILELLLIASVRYLSYRVRCNFVLRLWLRIGLIFRLLDNVTSNVRFLWRSVPNRVRIITMLRGSGFIKRANQERRVNSWLDCQSARRNLMLRSIFVTNQLYYTYIWIED